MNAPARAHEVEADLAKIPVAAILPSQTHIQASRRKRFDQAAIAELAITVKQLGVLEPVLARPLPPELADVVRTRGGELPRYELVAGERRWLAAQQAGLTEIPAIVRPLDDQDVIEIQLVENLQRTGLHELEEAEGYEALMHLKDINADAVAERIGRSRAYVYTRLKLLKLCPEARDAFYAGQIDSSRALIIARLGVVKQQHKALELATQKDWNGESYRLSVRRLREELAQKKFTITLKTAPFALDDSALEVFASKKATQPMRLPACVGCIFRTAETAQDGDDPDVCNNPPCYDQKVKAHADRLRADAKLTGKEIIAGDAATAIAPRKNTLVGYVDLDEPCPGDDFPEDEPPMYLTPADEEFDKVNPAWEAWDERGNAWKGRTYRTLLAEQQVTTKLLDDAKEKRLREIVPVKVAREALKKVGVELPSYVGQKPHEPVNYNSTEYKEKQAEQEARQTREEGFRFAVLEACFKAWKGPLQREQLVALAEEFVQNGDGYDVLVRLHADTDLNILKMKDAELVRLLAIATVADDVHARANPKGLLAFAKRLKVNPDKIKKQLADEEKAKAKAAADAAKAEAAGDDTAPKAPAKKKPAAKTAKGKKK